MRTLDWALRELLLNSQSEEAWRVLYRALWPGVIQYLSIHIRDQDLVQDAAQETFLRLLRADPHKSLTSPIAVRAYVRTIARHVAVDLIRKERRLKWLSLEDENVLESDLILEANNALSPDILNRLSEAISHLKSKDVQIIELILDGNTLSEVADTLGISLGAAAVRWHRLRGQIAKLLSDSSLP